MAHGFYGARDLGQSRPLASPRTSRLPRITPLFCAALLWFVIARDASAQFFTSDSIPHSQYFSTLSVYMDGDYREALKDFQTQSRIKGPNNALWIDSICI